MVPMAEVDPDEDSRRRFVVHHYRYDPQRRERRNVVVGAFDNKAEYQARMTEVSAELERRREAGEDVDPSEHVSGTVLESGYQRRSANARLLQRALEHGVHGEALRALWGMELPRSIVPLEAERLPAKIGRALTPWRRSNRGLFPRSAARPTRGQAVWDPETAGCAGSVEAWLTGRSRRPPGFASIDEFLV